jgi:putative ubiquitin-RnfH superfamily antitoxin RatB of RatAB toxin-antitoxin module
VTEGGEADGAGQITVGANGTESPAIASTTEVQALGPIRIEVVYACPDRAWRVQLTLPPGSTVLQAFEASGLRSRIAELSDQGPDLGVFANPVAHDRMLREGDRVEVYRPLLIDPKDARRKRAAQS